MKDPPAAGRLSHVAFEGLGSGGSFEETSTRSRLTDQQRLAVVMQGAALLVHLERTGLRLADGTAERAWLTAELSDGFLLRVGDVRVGRPVDLPQRLLLQLLRRLFDTEDDVVGRGAARRVARILVSHWRQELLRVPPDLALRQVLDAAPFLWQRSFGPARRALAAEYLGPEIRRLGIAGSGAAEARFLAAAEDHSGLLEAVAGDRALDLWDGFSPELDPWRLYRRGRWRLAAAVWRRRRSLRESEANAYAWSLIASGQAARALEVVRRRKDPASLLTRLRSQMELGERHAAYKTVNQLETMPLADRQVVKLADIAVRLCAARGHFEQVRSWVARALAVTEPKAKIGGLIVAAGAAWDAGEMEVMGGYLEQARGALDQPDLAWRWLQAEALRRYALGDGPGAVENAEAALLVGRRRLGRCDAARLWNEVGVMRLLADDLRGSERACTHVAQLLLDCDGSARESLGLHNLAALRIRRGRLRGVEEPLARNMAENLRGGNPRAWLRDLEVVTRLELARGRPAAALQRCGEAESRLAKLEESIVRPEIFAAFAGRAHGWMGHPERAAAMLEQAGDAGLRELDVEERPAAWALAREPDRAREAAEGTVWAPLFSALLAGQAPPEEAWGILDGLEAYRAARLIHDLELLRPGTVPAARSRRAAAVLRDVGAEAMAEVLDGRSIEPWRALRAYFGNPPEAVSAATLLRDAGYGEARLTWKGGGGTKALVEAAGGAARLRATVPGGILEIEAPWADATLEALLALLARDLFAAAQGKLAETPEPPETERTPRVLGDGMVGESEALLASLQRLDRLAAGELPVLVLGESGTGKELMARRAHRLSRRDGQPFLAVNCAAFSESLIQSELFGHVRGAFTGADRDRAGIFEAARGGTVFLDEIGDLPKPVQGHLLRVLQEGEIRRVGESMTRKIDVRVVAATHRDLSEMVEAGDFRRDLFFRLRVAKIQLPPLRDRGVDVILLTEHLLKKARGGPLSKMAERKLLAYPWPGNVRELKNVLEVAVALSDGGTIYPEHLDIETEANPPEKGDYHHQVRESRRRIITGALRKFAGNRSQAARSLGLSRQALSYQIRQLDLLEE